MPECVDVHEDGREACGGRYTRMYACVCIVGIYMFCCIRMCLYGMFILLLVVVMLPRLSVFNSCFELNFAFC